MSTLNGTTLQFIREHRTADVRTLALQSRKQSEVDMPAALTQIAGWQIAKVKVPTWAQTEGILYPVHLSMEQCSSEVTARYKRKMVSATTSPCGDSSLPKEESRLCSQTYSLETFTDLTGGFGIDCAFLASAFKQAIYVERQPALCDLARNNFPLLGLGHIAVCNADAVEHLQTMLPVDWIFIDPARRDNHGGKTIAIGDCEPDVCALEALLLEKARYVLVKLSPMLDLSLAMNDLHSVRAAHIVSVANECKELLLVLGHGEALHPDDVPIHCVNLLPDGTMQSLVFTRRQERESECNYATIPKQFLYEPNASVLKAGAFRGLARIYNKVETLAGEQKTLAVLEKLHPNSHLYTSDTYLPDFPGRKFRIEATGGFGKQEVKALLAGEKKANLTVRNFPASVADLRKRLHLSEGGDTYLFATTLGNEEKTLIRCKPVQVS